MECKTPKIHSVCDSSRKFIRKRPDKNRTKKEVLGLGAVPPYHKLFERQFESCFHETWLLSWEQNLSIEVKTNLTIFLIEI